MTRIATPNPVVIISKKSLGGRTWSNVWHFHVPGTTDPEGRVAYAKANISAVLNAFERPLHNSNVTLVDHYIGDTSEQRPPGITGSSFYDRVVYGNAGTNASEAGLTSLVPLNTALLMKCNVTSERAGFKFMKGLLADDQVQPGGRSGVILTGSLLGAFNTQLTAALTSSGMLTHLQGGTNAGDWVMATAHYRVVPGTTNRSIDHMSYVASLGYVGATARQVDRRRTKRTPKTEA